MARWIDASPSQRLHQYIVPAARRRIATGEWDPCIADYQDQVAEARAHLDGADPVGIDHRRWTRRLASLVRDLEGCIRQRDEDLAIIAEADRRKASQSRRA